MARVFITKASAICAFLLCLSSTAVLSEDNYRYFEWDVKYGNAAPMGVRQQLILINGKFPGPTINCTTNDNLIINIFNHLPEPLLFSWNGVQQRKNSWEDGMPGTNCPIMPGTNYTYRFQVKDQIGSFFYYPSVGMQKAAGGFGAMNINTRSVVPVPYRTPADDYNVLIGDWYTKRQTSLAKTLDSGHTLGRPAGVLINGESRKFPAATDNSPLFQMEANKTYKYRICNVGLRSMLSFRIQGHSMKLVEMDGTHTTQNVYLYLDVQVGQCVAVLISADQEPGDYYIVASARFNSTRLFESDLISTAVIRYVGSNRAPIPILPPVPSGRFLSAMQQLSFRTNLTANAARPNPQGSYKYGTINVTRTIRLASHKSNVHGKLRYGFNGVSHVESQTPLKLAQHFKATVGVFKYNVMPDMPPADYNARMVVAPNVITVEYRSHVEIIFENTEDDMQTFHLNGYSFFPVGMGNGTWSPRSRWTYNMVDAVSTHSVRVYPQSWAAIVLSFDNAGMWNLRSEILEKRYLGQQLYISVVSPVQSINDEYTIPDDVLLCQGVARFRHKRHQPLHGPEPSRNHRHERPARAHEDQHQHHHSRRMAPPAPEHHSRQPSAAPATASDKEALQTETSEGNKRNLTVGLFLMELMSFLISIAMLS